MPARPIALATAVTFVIVTAAFAQGGGPPRIDIDRVCRASAAEIASIFGDNGQDVMGTCKQDEQAALDQLQKSWGDFPSLAKERCVQPKEYLPSYVEWTACLEITRDVMKMRRERAANAASTDYQSKECPIVKIGEDGNVEWVDTCPTGRGGRHSSLARK
jgi:hypothetical protein